MWLKQVRLTILWRILLLYIDYKTSENDLLKFSCRLYVWNYFDEFPCLNLLIQLWHLSQRKYGSVFTKGTEILAAVVSEITS